MCSENDQLVAEALQLRSEVQSLDQVNSSEKREIEFVQQNIREQQQESVKCTDKISSLKDIGLRAEDYNEAHKNKVRSMEAEIQNNSDRITHQEQVLASKEQEIN